MSTHIISSDAVQTHRDPDRGRLLDAGLAAGPVLGLTWLIQGLVRDGYDFSRHPMSLLALGGGGWVQITNFMVTGGLMLACAVGLRSVLVGGPGARWAPRLVATIGLGLVVAGIFPVDAGAGFPAGAPQGAPTYTLVGVVHEVGYLLVVVAWIALCLVLRARFAQQSDRGWARACVIVVPAVIALVAVPHLESFPVRAGLAAVLQLLFVGLAARRLRG